MALLALVAAFWVALLIAAPLLPVPAAGLLYALGSRVCHQIPARSFHLFDAQLPVCGRCLGIYLGAALGMTAMAALGPRAGRILRASPRIVLVAGALPVAVTLVLEWSGAWSGSNVVRALSGVPLGAAAALVVAQGVAKLNYDRCAPRRPIAGNRPPTPI